jgi:lipopolysaccharide/colanic/teichoic acid biosynthesis glycosyltransferase
VLSPVCLAIAVAVKLSSAGPVFYKQQRVGRDGDVFTMWKFRTMVMGADRLRCSVDELDKGAGPLFKVREDPRITKIGRFLRRHSLDELPQLAHVVTGQMAMVGPRPPLLSEVEVYEDHVRRRLLVKPGLTGLWQISGRSNLDWDETVRLDLYYIDNWSVPMDLAIIAKTFFTVVRGEGAY